MGRVFVFAVIVGLILSEYSPIANAKKGGWVSRVAGKAATRALSSRKSGSKGYGAYQSSWPRAVNVGRLPVVGTVGRGGSAGRGVGRSAMTGVLAGLAAGYVGTKIGRHLAGGWHGGRYYYFDDRYYSGPGRYKIRCSVPTPADFPLTHEDGRRVRELIYECDRYREICCGDGCCRRY